MQLHIKFVSSSSLPVTTTTTARTTIISKLFLKTRRKSTKKTHKIPTSKKSLPYPKPTPAPLLLSSSSPPKPKNKEEAITQILQEIESTIDRGVRIDPSIFSSILESLFHANTSFHHVTLLHSLIPPSLLRDNGGISSKLIRLYASYGHVGKAHQLFDLMPERNRTRNNNAFAWNSLISGYVELGLYEDAMAIYYQMEEESVDPDCFTFPRALKACSGIGLIQHGVAVHRHIVRSGFGNDIFVLNALVDMYAKCGDILQARRIFERIVDRDSVTWNSMLVGYLRHGLLLEALDTCRGMISAGIEPDSITVSAMLAKFSCFEKLGLEIHCWVIRRGLEQNLSIANSLIGLYSERNQLSRAIMIFESIENKDIVSWNAIISAYRKDPRVLYLFRQMEERGQVPDKITFVSLLSACANLRMVEDGRRLFRKMVEKYKISPEMAHYGCMVNLLARAGLVEEAYHEIVLKGMPFDAGPTVWGALLYGCYVHGSNVEIGEFAAQRLFELEPDNELSFELMMKIYKNAGRLEGVERIKQLMRERGLESESCAE